MSLAVPSSCFWVRNSCRVPWVRWSYWMLVLARNWRTQSRQHSASRTMCPWLRAYRASVQLRSMDPGPLCRSITVT